MTIRGITIMLPKEFRHTALVPLMNELQLL